MSDNTSAAPFVGHDTGRVLIMTFRGGATGILTARHGLENDSTRTSTVRFTVTIGVQRISNAHVIPGPGTSTYSCNASSWVEHSGDGTETTWVRR